MQKYRKYDLSYYNKIFNQPFRIVNIPIQEKLIESFIIVCERDNGFNFPMLIEENYITTYDKYRMDTLNFIREAKKDNNWFNKLKAKDTDKSSRGKVKGKVNKNDTKTQKNKNIKVDKNEEEDGKVENNKNINLKTKKVNDEENNSSVKDNLEYQTKDLKYNMKPSNTSNNCISSNNAIIINPTEQDLIDYDSY